MIEPALVTEFPKASRAETLKTFTSPAVQIVTVVLNDVNDVVAHIDAGTTVRMIGIPTIGVMLNIDVEGMMLNERADDFQYNEAEASPVCSLYSKRME